MFQCQDLNLAFFLFLCSLLSVNLIILVGLLQLLCGSEPTVGFIQRGSARPGLWTWRASWDSVGQTVSYAEAKRM